MNLEACLPTDLRGPSTTITRVAAGLSGAGVYRIMHPAPIDHPWVNFLVLAASAGFEGASFLVSYREFRRVIGRRRSVAGSSR